VVEVIEDEDGVPLSVGRKRRTIAGALKRALHQRAGACVYPGCTNRLFLEGHHIKHWADGGETSQLGIDARTIAGSWDGTPVDYGTIAGHLVTADGLE
jgi:hypothetical protein